MHPRLGISLILQGKWSQLCCVFGACCSSFVQMSSGSTGRNLLTPEGRQDLPNVRYANQLLSRTACSGFRDVGFVSCWGKPRACVVGRTLLLMLLCVAAGGSVFLENPASSVMFDTKYFWRFVRCMKGAGLKATCLSAGLF